MSLPLDQIFNQQTPGQETQPQDNGLQSEESIHQWDDVTSGMNLEIQLEDDAFQPEEGINQENDVTSGMDQETHPQGNAFQSEKNINQWVDVTSEMDNESQPKGNAFQSEESNKQENNVTSDMDHENQSQGNAFQSEESINQGNDVASRTDTSLDKPSAHNRTVRNVRNPCISNIVRKFDRCRKKFVNQVQCLNRHVACYEAINRYHYPKCKTVIGFRQAKFMEKCAPLTVGCQCAV